ncbi:MAG: hypothetical protein PHG82_03810 [Candidatus Gracilibacteria bacterium]|nr:hypothetical protein [Candidatus Gracilibacteria bacterium]
MKTTMTISVDKDLKEAFSIFSREMGTTPTNLMNMMMKNTVNRRDYDVSGFEIEAFSKDEKESLLTNKSIQKSMAKLSFIA